MVTYECNITARSSRRSKITQQYVDPELVLTLEMHLIRVSPAVYSLDMEILKKGIGGAIIYNISALPCHRLPLRSTDHCTPRLSYHSGLVTVSMKLVTKLHF
jgi:hypothetical protein